MVLKRESKRKLYIIGVIILILFVVSLMLKFWIYTILAIGCFAAGYLYRLKEERAKKGGKRYL